ncbi:type II toxin-antitoxin system RelE family toxin [Sansalvadorimonas verongulae]|uniref:type II toxin-antitoxin system RelE family toxin n=1 Tax=Sansalvadorimonas verongulae TaxID=2172824 RepID=UPI0012BD030E|nr:type II toxin-antitoxin system RelE/ParE family toxin [Sansalvadorimonas verongulae]MTI11784.1 type II toxin-antitoxin system RelE/ParE family toxin [Sansalvadorimonas verongulae]
MGNNKQKYERRFEDKFELQWKRSVLKELRKLPKDTVGKLVDLAESLIANPYPDGCRKLTGTEHTYKVRAGNYRLVYQVHNGRLIIEVVKVGHRKEVYR